MKIICAFIVCASCMVVLYSVWLLLAFHLYILLRSNVSTSLNYPQQLNQHVKGP